METKALKSELLTIILEQLCILWIKTDLILLPHEGMRD